MAERHRTATAGEGWGRGGRRAPMACWLRERAGQRPGDKDDNARNNQLTYLLRNPCGWRRRVRLRDRPPRGRRRAMAGVGNGKGDNPGELWRRRGSAAAITAA